jgi:heat shock protein HtpX
MYNAVAANKRNTVIIMAVFIGVIGALGWLASYIWFRGSPSVTIGVVVVSAIYALVQYYAAGKLAVMTTGAQEITKADNPRLWRTVENLAITDGLPMPKVYIIDDPAPNAFATGRDPQHAIVAATTGLLEIMNDAELEGVIAHEMGHVKNYDIRVSMITFGLVSAIGMISDMALRMMWFGGGDNDRDVHPAVMIIGVIVILLAPVMAMLIQMAISRQREYLADASGALTTRYPEGLASALEKLQQYGQPMQRQASSTAHLFFNNPLKPGRIANLFSTHPPLEDRIARLRDNAAKF